VIDGKDITPLLLGQPQAKSPHEAFYYYHMDQLQAVRSGKWKLYLALEKKLRNLKGDTERSPARLYDVQAGPGETTNLADKHADLVQRLAALAEKARADLGDLDREGKGQRPTGRVENPRPLVLQPKP
jgi:arylsulfatase A-like enzyme